MVKSPARPSSNISTASSAVSPHRPAASQPNVTDGGGMGCIRKSLVVISVLYLIMGLIFIAMGLAFQSDEMLVGPKDITDQKEQSDELENMLEPGKSLKAAGEGFQAVGWMVVVIGLDGLWGACKNSRCILITYAVSIFGVLVVQFVILAMLLSKTNKSVSKKAFSETAIHNYQGFEIVDGDFSGQITRTSRFWDRLQIIIECCGYNDHTDFVKIAKSWKFNRRFPNLTIISSEVRDSGVEIKKYGDIVPVSCCKTKQSLSTLKLVSDLGNYKKYVKNIEKCVSKADPEFTNTKGCSAMFDELLTEYADTAKYICATLGILQVTSLIMACMAIRTAETGC